MKIKEWRKRSALCKKEDGRAECGMEIREGFFRKIKIEK